MEARQALQQSEEKYRILTNTMKDVVTTISLTGEIIFVSDATFEFGGYKPEEEIGKHFSKYIANEKDLIRALAIFNDVGLDKKSGLFEFMYKPKEDKPFPAEVAFSPIIKNKKVNSIVLVVRNISKRKKVEKQLKESEKRFRELYMGVPVGLYRTTFDGQILEGNKAIVDMLGFPDKEALLKINANDIVISGTRNKQISDLEQNNMSKNYEFKLKKYNGDTISVIDNAKAVRNKKGEIKYMEGSLLDITEQVKIQDALKKSEEKYRIIFENSNEAVLIMRNNRFITCNRAAVQMFGYKSQDELIQRHPYKLIPEKQPNGVLSSAMAEQKISTAYEKGECRFEWTQRRKNGDIFPADIWLTAIKYNNELLLHTVCRNLTKRKTAEQKIRDLSTAIEQSANMVVIMNLDREIEYVNPKFIEVTGYSKNEIIGRNPKILRSGSQPETYYNKMWDTITEGNIWNGELIQ